jgi:hypothetical protein
MLCFSFFLLLFFLLLLIAFRHQKRRTRSHLQRTMLSGLNQLKKNKNREKCAAIVRVESMCGQTVFAGTLDKVPTLYALQCAVAGELKCIPAQVNLLLPTAGAQDILRTTEEYAEAVVSGTTTVLCVIVEKASWRMQDVLFQLYGQVPSPEASPVMNQVAKTGRIVYMGGVGLILRTCYHMQRKQCVKLADILLRVEMDVPFQLATPATGSCTLSSVQAGPHLHVRDATDFGFMRGAAITMRYAKRPTKIVVYERVLGARDTALTTDAEWVSVSWDSREGVAAVTKYFTAGFFPVSQVEGIVGKELYKSVVLSCEVQQNVEHFRERR